jgi:hypothetical protein
MERSVDRLHKDRAVGTLHTIMNARILSGLLLLSAVACAHQGEPSEQGTWFKGNTHTHTLWSDGDGAPEMAVAWYKELGYQFLVLSDHNIFQDTERWFPVTEPGEGRLGPAELDMLVKKFGADAVELREIHGRQEMRLLTLSELAQRFEEPGQFLLVPGEEVTANFDGNPVHINAVNIAGLIPSLQRDSVSELLNDTLDAIAAHGVEHGRPVLAHLNHPNFGWGLTWQDVASMRSDQFFEVYNGHRGVRNHGDPDHPSTEEIWDLSLVLRLTELGLPLLYGVATDDTHHYHGSPTAQPGRGWIMVRATDLESDSLVNAMKNGDFYASSGVSLSEVVRGQEMYRVEIEASPGVVYTTRFLGTRMQEGQLGTPGEVLMETTDNPAVYAFGGDELYVRAVVTSSVDHPNPYAEGDKEAAWAQPVQVLFP